MPITKRDVDHLQPNSVIWDSGRGSVSGFGVRRQRAAQVFVLKVTQQGKGRWITIGRFGAPWTVEAARAEALRLLGMLAAGEAVVGKRDIRLQEAGTKPLTVSELCDQYLIAAEQGRILTRFKRPKKASTLADDRGRVNRHIRPLIGASAVQDVSRQMVAKMVADIAAGKTVADEKTGLRGRAIVTGGHITAARVADLLSGIMAWAVDEGHLSHNPVHGVRRFRPQPRQRFLSDDEIRALGRVIAADRAAQLKRFHPYALSVIELLCLTGCRLNEIAALRWHEVDEQSQCLRLADTKTGQSMRAVGQAAMRVIQDHPRIAQSPFLFPASRGEGAYQGTKRQARAIFEAAGLEGVSCHTLRHTFGSIASGMGYADATIGGLLGHAGRGVTSRYIHRPDEAQRTAADAIASKITVLLALQC